MNNQRQYTFIWDMDGTLIDSYGVIVESLYQALEGYSVQWTKEDIYHFIKNKSVHEFVEHIVKIDGVPLEEYRMRYDTIEAKGQASIGLMVHGKETLEALVNKGAKNYIYTHKDDATNYVLKNYDIDQLFEEVITSNYGFKRKPDPEALFYLIDKYNLDVEYTYYVGDRILDIECAKNAGVKSIFLTTEDHPMELSCKPDYIVNDLLEIVSLVQ